MQKLLSLISSLSATDAVILSSIATVSIIYYWATRPKNDNVQINIKKFKETSEIK
jgi:hypothetical protein